MSDSMIEKAAKAMCRQACEAAYDAGEGARCIKCQCWTDEIPAAKAAIAAMRTPTAHMGMAGHAALERKTGISISEPASLEVWQAMIDVILAEQP